MRILVTGAAGFLGSHLVDSYLADGHSVLGIDNLSTGNEKNINHIANNKNFEFVNYDVTDSLVGFGKFDIILNMACMASPPKYQANPLKTFSTSVDGIRRVVESANLSDAVVFQASTSEVYGDPTVDEQKETYHGNVNCFGPRSCYDEGKRAAETYLLLANQKFGTKIRIARIFNTYGPRMDPEDGRVVTNFINQALRKKDITIYGSGEQTRSFCYVDDLILGIKKLVDSDLDSPTNIGNPSELTVANLARKIIDMTESESKIVFCDRPIDDPMKRRPNIDKAKKELGWYPTVDIQEGLEKTINYFRNYE